MGFYAKFQTTMQLFNCNKDEELFLTLNVVLCGPETPNFLKDGTTWESLA